MDIILNLPDWKKDGFYLKSTDTKKGTTSNTTMGGVTYNILDFIDYNYDLKLIYLTTGEAKEINKQFIELCKSNQKLEFYLQDIEKLGFTCFSTNTRVALNIEPSKINLKPSKIPNLYDLTIECFERVFI